MKNNAKNISLSSYDDIFSTEESRADAGREKVMELPLSELFPFKNHPFKVLDDEAMQDTAESIREHGVLVPAIARPREYSGYELISGHRRKRACELAGLDTMPVIVRELDDNAATIIMVDSNIQRENILPSERALAYKMKLEAIKRQGARTDLTSTQVAQKLRFYFGVLIVLLVTVFALMKQRDALNAKVHKKELAISQEMPRFVRTLCRSLQSDRDLISVIIAYRKAAGPELGGELDILIAEMQSGNVQSALVHFENRVGLPEASRLCGALRDMSLGIDQTATLSYIADDMARAAKENIRKELSLRPGKMRRTYYPAIGVCIAMILYVLVVYVINNFNNLY